MAIIFDDVSIRGLRLIHFRQLLDYLEERERAGWYIGNRKQYEQRHMDLKNWLNEIIEYASKEGIVIPKK